MESVKYKEVTPARCEQQTAPSPTSLVSVLNPLYFGTILNINLISKLLHTNDT
jgi:arginine/lysine/ornithine decarboxylase